VVRNNSQFKTNTVSELISAVFKENPYNTSTSFMSTTTVFGSISDLHLGRYCCLQDNKLDNKLFTHFIKFIGWIILMGFV